MKAGKIKTEQFTIYKYYFKNSNKSRTWMTLNFTYSGDYRNHFFPRQ